MDGRPPGVFGTQEIAFGIDARLELELGKTRQLPLMLSTRPVLVPLQVIGCFN